MSTPYFDKDYIHFKVVKHTASSRLTSAVWCKSSYYPWGVELVPAVYARDRKTIQGIDGLTFEINNSDDVIAITDEHGKTIYVEYTFCRTAFFTALYEYLTTTDMSVENILTWMSL